MVRINSCWKRIILLLFFLLVATTLFLCPNALAWSGKVVGVTDGDTIKVMHDGKEEKIRLYGIDCPEKKQAFGNRAKTYTASLVAGKVAEVEEITKDRYGRTVALVVVGPVNVNEEIIKAGFAWVYCKYCQKGFCTEWLAHEEQARKAGKGLWYDPAPLPPWEWRQIR